MKAIDSKYKFQRNNGYAVKDLIVSPIFDSFKSELLHSGFVTAQQWQTEIIAKAEGFINAEHVKKIKCRLYKTHHGIPWRESISLRHMFSLIAYCDFSDLCTFFSATFRKKDEFESIANTKQRNAKFYHFSKALIECVMDFGMDGKGKWDANNDWIQHEWSESSYGSECGPFFCGLSWKLKIPQFAIFLSGPCSTTKFCVVFISFVHTL